MRTERQTLAKCYFCDREVDEDDFCYGCKEYICEDCDSIFILAGEHSVDDHSIDDHKED